MDKLLEKHRSWNMSRIKSSDTKPEKMLRALLFREGFRFRKNVKSLPGCPDIVLRKYKTIIFVHGCFWHRHSGCSNSTMPQTRYEFWQKKFSRTVHRDQIILEQLKKMGWSVLIAWECEILKKTQLLLENLTVKIRKGMSDG